MNRHEFLKLCGVIALVPVVAKMPEAPGEWAFIHKWHDAGDEPIDMFTNGSGIRYLEPFPNAAERAWLYNDGKGRGYIDHLVSAWN